MIPIIAADSEYLSISGKGEVTGQGVGKKGSGESGRRSVIDGHDFNEFKKEIV